jgi:hypothetical protein
MDNKKLTLISSILTLISMNLILGVYRVQNLNWSEGRMRLYFEMAI